MSVSETDIRILVLERDNRRLREEVEHLTSELAIYQRLRPWLHVWRVLKRRAGVRVVLRAIRLLWPLMSLDGYRAYKAAKLSEKDFNYLCDKMKNDPVAQRRLFGA